MEWTISSTTITMTMSSTVTGWVAVGFTDISGKMGPSDVYFGWLDASGTPQLSDRTNGAGYVQNAPDAQQDGQVQSASISGGRLSVTFTRALDTGDADDRVITDGMNVIWSAGTNAPADPTATISYHQNRGFTTIYFLSAAACSVSGTAVTARGYVMDNFCIQRGTLLDNPSVQTLKNPELHSIHCLVDVSVCVNSGYAILERPTATGDYQVKYQLSTADTLLVKAEAEAERHRANKGMEVEVSGVDDGSGELKCVVLKKGFAVTSSGTPIEWNIGPEATPSPSPTPAPAGGNRFCAQGDLFCLEWSISSTTITMTMSSKVTGWVAVGFTDISGKMGPSDVYFGWLDASGTPQLSDRTNGAGYVQNAPDAQQDGQVQSASISGGRLSVTFTRALDTGDVADDRVITNAMNVIWSAGTNTPTDPTATISYHQNRGFTTINFLSEAPRVSASPSPSPPPSPTPGPAGGNRFCAQGDLFCLEWNISSTTITMTMSSTVTGWVAVGFTDISGKMGPSDVYFGWLDASGTPQLSDRTNGAGYVQNAPDAQQDGQVQSASISGGRLSVTFTRALDTGDVADDRVITDGMNVIWSAGTNTPTDPTATISYHQNRGFTTINFLSEAPRVSASPSPSPPPSPTPGPAGGNRFCAQGDLFCLEWTISSTTITMTMSSTVTGWVAVGFTDISGKMGPSDVYFGWLDAFGTPQLSDRTNGAGYVQNAPDAQQDGQVQSASISGGRLSVTFTRALDTGDAADDRVITDGMNVIWAAGTNTPTDPTATISYHQNRGFTTIDFLSGVPPVSPTPAPSPSPPPSPPPSPTPPLAGVNRFCAQGDLFCLEWTISSTTITMTMSSTVTGWVAVGFTDISGKMGPSDVYFGWLDAFGTPQLSDRTNGAGYVQNAPDAQQDGQVQSASISGGRLSVTFTRALDTGDAADDRVITDGMNVIWGAGASTPSASVIRTAAIISQHTARGATAVDFLTGAAGASPTPVSPALSPSPPPAGVGRFCAQGEAFCLEWTISSTTITMTMSSTATGWVAVGFTDISGKMGPADVYFGWLDTSGTPQLSDRTNGAGYVQNAPDAQQDGQVQSASISGGRLSVTFTRALDTGDVADDRVITDGMNVIWSAGTNTPTDPTATISYHQNRGFTTINFLSEAPRVSASPSPSPPPSPTPGPAGGNRFCAQGDLFCLEWTISSTTITMTMSSTVTGWVAVGFTDISGKMGPSDVYFGWLDAFGTPQLSDRTNGAGYVQNAPDAQQDGQVQSASISGGRLSVTFTRALDTGDAADDRVITDGMNVIWAAGTNTPTDPTATISYHQNRGFTTIDFLSGVPPVSPTPAPSPSPPPSPPPSPTPPLAGVNRFCAQGDLFCLEWNISSTTITMTMSSTVTGWVAVGFTDISGKMGPSDVYFGWLDAFGTPQLSDRTNGAGYVQNAPDAQQDGQVQSASISGGRLSVTFTRALDTGDAADDRVITDGMNVIWGAGASTPSASVIRTAAIISQHTARGATAVDFLTGAAGASPTPVSPALSPSPPPAGVGRFCAQGEAFCLEWTISSTTITMTMSSTATGWVAVGFTDISGKMGPADVYFGWLDTSGTPQLSDRTNGAGYVQNAPDVQQDGQVQSASISGGRLSVTFTRALDTGDADDRVITDGMNVIWGAGSRSPGASTARAASIIAQHTTRGAATLNVLSAAAGTSPSPVSPAAPAVSPSPVGGNTFCAQGDLFCLEWSISSTTITMTMSSTVTGYVSVGFTDVSGKMGPADVYFGWLDASGTPQLSDRTNGAGYVQNAPDAQQDGQVQSASISGGRLSVTFTRALDTGDVADDRVITNAMNVIWAAGPSTPSSTARTAAAIAQHTARGAAAVDFLSGAAAEVTADWQFWVPTAVLAVLVGALVLFGVLRSALRPAAHLSLHAQVYQRRFRKGLWALTRWHPLPPLQTSRIHRLTLDFLPALFDLSLGEIAVSALWIGALVSLLAFEAIEVTGRMAAFALATALLPTTKHSLFATLLGSGFERLIQFHRWVARATLVLAIVHMAMVIDAKGSAVLVSFEAYEAGYGGAGYGLVTLVLLAATALVAIEPIRRKAYEVFHFPHLLLSLAAVAMAMLHSWVVCYLMIIPLALWVGDKLVMAIGLRKRYVVSLVETLEGGACRVEVQAGTLTPFAYRPGQYFFVNVPSVSKAQWHPFTAAGRPHTDTLRFIMRNMGPGSFTDRVPTHAAVGARVLLNGPHGSAFPVDPTTCRILFLVAGGVGVTPIVSIADHILEHHADGFEKVHFVWVGRDFGALQTWCPGTLDAMRASPMFVLQMYDSSAAPASGTDVHTPTSSEKTDAADKSGECRDVGGECGDVSGEYVPPEPGARGDLQVPSAPDPTPCVSPSAGPWDVPLDGHLRSASASSSSAERRPDSGAGAGGHGPELPDAARDVGSAYPGTLAVYLEDGVEASGLPRQPTDMTPSPPSPTPRVTSWDVVQVDKLGDPLPMHVRPGRPDWDEVLGQAKGRGRDVQVFVCGPAALEVNVQRRAQRWGYLWHKETFNF